MPSAQSKTTFIDPPSVAASKQEEDSPANDEAVDEVDESEARTETAERTEAERTEAEPDAEARARKMGWRPRDEYEKSGRDPEKWVNADEFIRRGENELPVLRERFRKLEKRSEKQDKQLDEGNKLLRDLVASQKTERDKAVKKAISELTEKRKEASSIGDAAAVEAISGEIEEQKEALKAPVAAEREASADAKAEIPEDVLDWVDENRWFNESAAMNATAVEYYGDLLKDPANKRLSEKEKLARVRAEVVKRFPEKFGNPRRTQPSSVEGGNGNGSGRRKMDKGWNDLPRDAQDIADRLIRQGAVKDRASYLKDYAW